MQTILIDLKNVQSLGGNPLKFKSTQLCFPLSPIPNLGTHPSYSPYGLRDWELSLLW